MQSLFKSSMIASGSPHYSSGDTSHYIRRPFTPHFLMGSDSGISSLTHSVYAVSGFGQNRYSNTLADPTTRTIICGFEGYRTETVDSYYTGTQYQGDVDDEATGTNTLDYNFVETAGSESAGWQVSTTGSFYPQWAPSPTHSQTSTYRILGDPANAAGHSPYVWKEVTLSDELGATYIDAKASEWQTLSETFRAATGGTDYSSPVGVSKSESADSRAFCGSGHHSFRYPSEFRDDTPSEADNEADLWDGNFKAHRRMTVSMLYPTLYYTGSELSTSRGVLAEGINIYNKGFLQTQLSNEITENKLRDEYGLFDEGSSMLNDAPTISEYSLLSTYTAYTEDNADNEVTFVSRFGEQVKIKFEVVRYYLDPTTYEETVSVVSFFELITDENTLRVSHTFGDLPEPQSYDEYYDIRVGSLSRKVVVDEVEQWVVVADHSGNLPNPEPLLSDTIMDKEAVILVIHKIRTGSLWGHQKLKNHDDTRYRTMTYTKELEIQTDLDEGDCGSDVTGSFELSYVDDYDASTGLIQERNVTAFEMTADSIDWTAQDYEYVDGALPGSATLITDTDTLERYELDDTWEDKRFEIAMDSGHLSTSYMPYAGKIVSQSWLGDTVTDEDDGNGNIYNLVDETGFPVPSAGQTIQIDMVALTES